MKQSKFFLSLVTIISVISASFGLGTAAFADVTPNMTDEVLEIGESVVVEKTVTTPDAPLKLDFLLLVDLSGSYGDDLVNIKALDDGIFDGIKAEVADSQFAVASFIDFPTSPWGILGDYPYFLDGDFTTDKATWTGVIDGLSLGNGNDFPESQYSGLKGAAEGASWRPDAVHVIAITTDASFHVPADTGGTYPGPSEAVTLAALALEDIKVIAIKAPGAGFQMDDIASDTGGSVVTTGASSAEIADAILEGIAALPVTVVHEVVGCDPLLVTFDLASDTVAAGEDAHFTETIKVPNDELLRGTSVHCEVDFLTEAGEHLGTQELWIEIPGDEVPPIARCIETVNPHGKTIPKAGLKSPGQNEDGFYELLAEDDEDLNPQIFVTDSETGTVFGPFESGTAIKYTEANGATPSIKPMAGGGAADAVDWKIKGQGDALVHSVDAFGNLSDEVECLVPNAPK